MANEMPQLVSCGLNSPLQWEGRIQENASSQSVVVGEERIHLRTLLQASLVESDAEIQLHQGEDIGDWARAQSEPVA